MKIILVAAITKNFVIGKNGSMPWHEPEDLKHFYATVKDKVVLLGANTFKGDLKEKPVQGSKQTLVLSRSKLKTDLVVLNSPEEVFSYIKEKKIEELFVLGGASVFQAFLPNATDMILTHLPYESDGNAFFPRWNEAEWEKEKIKDLGNDIKVFHYKRKT